MAMVAGSPDALAKQLRDLAVRRHDYPVSVVREMVEGWRRDPGIDPWNYVNIGNANGKAPLHFAAQLRDDGLAELLLELEADVNCTTARGHTPLIYACGRGRNGTVLDLLRAGARCRVRTANGDTAQRMASGRLPCSTLEALERAEAKEEGGWLDFMSDERAIAAQADHVQRHPQCAQWACDIPPAVADVLEQRRLADERQSPHPQLAETLAQELLPCWHEPQALAAVLLRAAEPLSRKQALTALKAALLKVASDPALGELHLRLLPLMRLAGPVLSEAARTLAATEESCAKNAKEAKMAVTSAVLSILRKLRTSASVPVATLAANAPAWMTVELLSPPTGVVLDQDKEALEDVLRRLCHERAWGSDFGTALRWLASLRPGARAVDEHDSQSPSIAEQEAFDRLVTIYVELAAAACRAGPGFRRYLKDDGSLLKEATALLGTAAIQPIVDACEGMAAGKGRGRALVLASAPAPAETPQLRIPPDAAFLRMPEGVEVHWVDSADAWAKAQARLEVARRVAIDTEWWDCGCGPALVQLAVGDGLNSACCFLLDTLAAPQVLGKGLLHLFEREDVEVIGWSFGEDKKRLAELCAAATGEEAMNPASFGATDLQPRVCEELGATSQVSLALACMHILGHPLDKREQCSDWRRRPLTKEQEEYAALDALVLLELQSQLAQRMASEASRAG